MKAIAIDDEKLILKDFVAQLKTIDMIDEVHGFSEPFDALDYIQINKVDVAFLDVNMGAVDGLDIAKQIREIQSSCAVVFVTGYQEYAVEAFKLRASGYILKPATTEDIIEELHHLRLPVKNINQCRLRVQCFGNFEVFYDNIPVSFGLSKTKELFAYLVDRNGASVNTNEILMTLWEQAEDTPSTRSYVRTLVSDLAKTLNNLDEGEVFIKKRNRFSVNKTLFECDYYEFLKKNPAAINAYNSEYMVQYSWSEMTLGGLERKRNRDIRLN